MNEPTLLDYMIKNAIASVNTYHDEDVEYWTSQAAAGALQAFVYGTGIRSTFSVNSNKVADALREGKANVNDKYRADSEHSGDILVELDYSEATRIVKRSMGMS